MPKNDILPKDILLALVLLTRLPLPQLPPQAFQRQAKAVWAFPLAGLAVALPAALLASLTLAAGLPAQVAAGLALATQILLTGAMHEDGLADTADGLWGGFNRERRLEIMKDSRIGAYGVIALILGLGLRWSALSALFAAAGVWPLLVLAMMSRAVMPALMAALPNARAAGLSQAVGRPHALPCLLAAVLAVALSLLLIGGAAIGAALAMATATAGLGALAKAKIGGQTGDILGASQQIAEIAGLLSLLAICR
ncbi:adenosylcobinamide-GDP ribazoletransferase [Leisingera sp. ANG-M7]|uniref:adenosylcobinamide-GDP ribazoletransferase n=1 Tax=Leisingera sp. ANG-M7 TaxID=1577902 RepID=UPI00057D9BBD|nr:adenosylcobinamide-GDP ribazoletransferase [Leisingera sp. ANG-M7]KIC39702.1 cobalamin biosynthesis protein CobS [Leisingera sp. ANG-M7]